MKKEIGLFATTLVALSGCGSDSSSDSSNPPPNTQSKAFDISQYAPVSGSDSIIGTWVGIVDYTNTDTQIPFGLDYSSTETGKHRIAIQISANGIGGFHTFDCNGNLVDVAFSQDSMTMRLQDRNIIVANYSTGSNDYSFNSEDNVTTKNETSKWVKVSNDYDSGLGMINLIRDFHSQEINADLNLTHTINTFCQTRNKTTDSLSAHWGEEIDIFVYSHQDEAFRFYASKNIYETDSNTIGSSEWDIFDHEGNLDSISTLLETENSYKASYEGNTTHDYNGEPRVVTIKATANVVIPK